MRYRAIGLHAAAIILAVLVTALPLRAQDGVYIQVESQRELLRAEERARDFAQLLPDVVGYAAGGGWYAIALGPYPEGQAQALLRQLRGQGAIPGDSYIVEGATYGRQFWPVGANIGRSTPSLRLQPPATFETPPDDTLPDETRTEALRSEQRLTRSERELLQIALREAGYYSAAIDGAFGRGTRNSMADWQAARGYEVTGVLTTAQRAALIEEYNAPIAGLGLAPVTNAEAGIELVMPTEVVSLSTTEPPFVHFEAADGSPAKVLMISQTGDRNTLFGLYDIMQTLEIVPLEGTRERGRDSFLLTGANDRIASHTYAELRDGMVKGFTLVWEAGKPEQFDRVVQAMTAGFRTFNGALADDAGAGEIDPQIDLLAGLQIRQPERAQSGFYVSGDGTVLTAASTVANCGRITIDDTHAADVTFSDATLGIALLRPRDPLAPMSFASFRLSTPRLQTEVAVAGYSYAGRLGAPTLTYGTLAEARGLAGETSLHRVALEVLPGDAGGPVFDPTGAVLGMLLPKETPDGRQLPPEVNFVAQAQSIVDRLTERGVQVTSSTAATEKDPVDLTTLATDMTVLVSCWN